MPDKLTERLKEIREREQKATPGPWVAKVAKYIDARAQEKRKAGTQAH